MWAAAGAAERLIAAIPQRVPILKAPGTLTGGGLKGADRTEFASHRQRTEIEDGSTERGLANNLHGAGRNPRGGSRGAHRGSRVAAIQPNRLADPALQVEVR